MGPEQDELSTWKLQDRVLNALHCVSSSREESAGSSDLPHKDCKEPEEGDDPEG